MSAMILSPLPAPLTSATTLRMHLARDRSDTDPATVPVTQDADGQWVAAPPANLVGRFWPTLVGTITGGAAATVDLGYVDLPEDDTLVVSPETIANKASMSLPLSAEQRDTITEAILDAQADVEGYLGRPIVPITYVETGRYPAPDGWDLVEHGDDPVLLVLAAIPETDPETSQPTGYYTITYTAGLDAKHDEVLRPIRRYVAAHALNSPEVTRLWTSTGGRGEVRSISAEGQSISFGPASLGGGGSAGSGAPGALPTLASLDRWRLAGRRVHVAKTRARTWPYSPVGWS